MIGNYLVRSDLDENRKSKYEKSHERRTSCLACQNCNAIIKGPTINHPTQGHPIQLGSQFTCNSTNVIYLINCPCGKCYVGQTSRAIKIHLNEHRSSIRQYQNKRIQEREEQNKSDKKFGETTVARHFYGS